MAIGKFKLGDLRHVMWLATLKLAVARSFMSAMIIGLAMLVTGAPAADALAVSAIWTVGAPVGLPLAFLGYKGMNAIFDSMAVNLFIWSTALMSAIGDPLVYVLNRQFPDLLQVKDFKLFNFIPAIFVFDVDGDGDPDPVRKEDFL